MFHFVCIPKRNFLSAPGRSGNSVFTTSELGEWYLPDANGRLVETGTHTKPEQSLVFHPLCTADHVSTVTLGEFIVAYIVALHPPLL